MFNVLPTDKDIWRPGMSRLRARSDRLEEPEIGLGTPWYKGCGLCRWQIDVRVDGWMDGWMDS